MRLLDDLTRTLTVEPPYGAVDVAESMQWIAREFSRLRQEAVLLPRGADARRAHLEAAENLKAALQAPPVAGRSQRPGLSSTAIIETARLHEKAAAAVAVASGKTRRGEDERLCAFLVLHHLVPMSRCRPSANRKGVYVRATCIVWQMLTGETVTLESMRRHCQAVLDRA
jgi:hypothetical protein